MDKGVNFTLFSSPCRDIQAEEEDKIVYNLGGPLKMSNK